MSDLVLPQKACYSALCRALTIPKLLVLICKANNVCSHFALQISRFMSVNKLKYFFAVDTRYVMKKLIILMFPYTHQVISYPPSRSVLREGKECFITTRLCR